MIRARRDRVWFAARWRSAAPRASAADAVFYQSHRAV